MDAKIRDVVGLYLNPPDKAVVVCVDEKKRTKVDHYVRGRGGAVFCHSLSDTLGGVLAPDRQSKRAEVGDADDMTQAGRRSANARTTNHIRSQAYITDRITAGVSGNWPVEAGRYRLVAARACPWANRAIIVRRLLGIEGALSIGLCGPTHDERSWTFDLDPDGRDPVLGYERLQEAFFARIPSYSRGITVPAIIDIPSRTLVTNDYAQMTLDFSTEWTAYHRVGAPRLYPDELRDEMDAVMERVYTDVNSGVYHCGFAASQKAYDDAYRRLFATLDWLDDRLKNRRYLMGASITEADVRLFTTLVRFDAVYHGHFKCNRNKLSEMRVLWAYARDLFQTPGFGDTIDFPQIKQHYYVVHTRINPTQIVPIGPDTANWLSPHGREDLGGKPFGDGTPPPPPPVTERVPAGHGPQSWVEGS